MEFSIFVKTAFGTCNLLIAVIYYDPFTINFKIALSWNDCFVFKTWNLGIMDSRNRKGRL